MIIASVLFLVAVVLSIGGFLVAGYAYNFHRREFHKIREWEEMVVANGNLRKFEDDIAKIEKNLADKTSLLAKAEDLIAEGNKCKHYIEDIHPTWKKDEETQNQRLSVINTQVAEKREELFAIKQQFAEAEALINRIEELKRELEKLSPQKEELNKEKKRLDEILNGTDENNHHGLRWEIQELEKQKQKVSDELQPLKDEKKILDGQINALNDQLGDKKKELKQAEKRMYELEREAKLAETRQKVAQAALDALGGSFDKVESIKRGTVEIRKAAFEGLYKTVFHDAEVAKDDEDEKGALVRLRNHVRAKNFDFPERLLYAFHTALKTSDISCLTVMAGVSGTGKSALPKLYAEAMGIHLCMLSVEPRWDSPRDLFGFFNYMENRYEATQLARALVQFDQFGKTGNDLKDQMLLVLLDEMNLARIEYYFSEYLSKLELRRELIDNINAGNEVARQKVSMELFAGWKPREKAQNKEDEKREYPIHLYAGENVLFAGTMNEDETTQSLSDKVIDRANVLHFGRPQKLKDNRQGGANAESNHQAPGYLHKKVWCDQWCRDITTMNLDGFKTRLDDLNTVLDNVNRPFAHRTSKAILAYVANYPLDNMQERAFADQIAMRIMPKLRGLDLDMYSNELTAVRKVVENVNDDALRDAFNKALGKEKHGFFRWQGINWGA